MKIKDTRHVTPDDYSITDVRVSYQWDDGTEYPCVVPYLHISLEPQVYMRDCFGVAQSADVKKHGAREISISHSELEKINRALNDEVQLCHRILLEHKLIPELRQARAAKYSKQTSPAK